MKIHSSLENISGPPSNLRRSPEQIWKPQRNMTFIIFTAQ